MNYICAGILSLISLVYSKHYILDFATHSDTLNFPLFNTIRKYEKRVSLEHEISYSDPRCILCGNIAMNDSLPNMKEMETVFSLQF